ncbi:MAG: glycerol-3-phosphate 1-O-acyltransferase PlsY [Elusimicrobiota bacterium]|nr:glycerol-3-phosphate 1-O-acyltransferase PlsY [Elusimicrobiota bacterium]
MIDFRDAALILFGYFAGGIPTGYLVVKRLKGYDIRTKGSGNPGTANVYRNAGVMAGAITLIVDALKGYAPVHLSLVLQPRRPELAIACGAAAIIGHNWTPLLGFKGGKGVATSAGVFLALMPWPMFATMAAFALAVKVSGHISVGSITAACALPIAAVAFGQQTAYCIAAGVSGALIVYKHIPNIKRLIENKELGIHGPSA